MSSKDVIENIVSDFEAIQKEFQNKAQTALRTVFKEFFDANPKIGSIYWTQYSPYFNDGEECTFGVHEMYAVVGKWSEEDMENYVEDRENTISSYSDALGEHAEEIKNFQIFARIVNRIPNEVYESTFGNHAEITATRDGFDVEEYEHE